MFKRILFFMFISTVLILSACSERPSDVSKQVWNDSINIVDEIDNCFENDCEFDPLFDTYMVYMDNMIEMETTDKEWEIFESVDEHFSIFMKLAQERIKTQDEFDLLGYIVAYKKSFNEVSNLLGLKKQYE